MFKAWDTLAKGCIDDPTGKNVATLSCVPAVFINLLNALLAFAGLVALTMFLMGSLKLMNSQGDAKKLASAGDNYKFAIIGLAVVFASILLMNIVSKITGVECITKFGFICI